MPKPGGSFPSDEIPNAKSLKLSDVFLHASHNFTMHGASNAAKKAKDEVHMSVTGLPGCKRNKEESA